MLNISNLTVRVNEQAIINQLNLSIASGEVHVIMGPNGAGKSTLAAVLAGKPDYVIESGDIQFDGVSLSTLTPEQRAHQGLFLAMQYPVEIPGISNIQFLKTSVNAIRKARQEAEVDAMDFLTLVRKELKTLEMDEELLYRPLNEGFSGGEKKRNEMLQMLLQSPRFAILDEIDSGLDVDGLRVISETVARLRDPKRSFLIITHNPNLLQHLKPDHVHVLSQGKIIKSGDMALVRQIEAEGFTRLQEA